MLLVLLWMSRIDVSALAVLAVLLFFASASVTDDGAVFALPQGATHLWAVGSFQFAMCIYRFSVFSVLLFMLSWFDLPGLICAVGHLSSRFASAGLSISLLTAAPSLRS